MKRLHTMTGVTMKSIQVLGLILAVGQIAGCSQFDLRKKIPWGKGEDGLIDRPTKVVAMWTDTICTIAGQVPSRGFGGRIYFYDTDPNKPRKVKGSLVVFAFDETDRAPTNTKPDRKFVFTQEQFEKHYSQSALGHSYSVWIPWDDVGGPQKEISLLVRFTTEEGALVVGDMSRVLLNGTPSESSVSPNSPNNPLDVNRASEKLRAMNGVNHAAHESTDYNDNQVQFASGEVDSPEVGNQKKMTVQTIDVPYHPSTTIPYRRQSHGEMLQNQRSPSEQNAPATTENPRQEQKTSLPNESSIRFGSRRSRVLGGPIARKARDHDPWQPRHVKWRSALEAQSAPGTSPTYVEDRSAAE